ncbi:Rpn family recombination-promoting nuclease/putative transposase [Cupriavidus respiraculi]|uniref:Rpn family recombination-promoting nuclease/putative transposase n=1 Tax=Cupriavidus respiraculi TaxID=195930 RepID=UPI001C95ED18|nr:Rpn family recombination-promoting nuclease/putative transposase [Cupriavidus respiraculi]MBY4946184.1 Rpn family recombination-promoting nuclease/putative transposase [Cupriavidus respiraculi]
MTKAFDAPYKLLFSSPDLVRDLILGFIPDAWLHTLDFDTLEKVSGNFVTDCLRERANDVVWRVKASEEWVYLYLLIEFQSTVDRYMALRVMTYLGLLYQDVVRGRVAQGRGTLPPVLPIVLYNGERPWTAATDIAALVPRIPGPVGRYQPRLSYLLIDQNQFEPADLARMQNLMAWVIRFERPQSDGAMVDLVGQLDEMLAGKEELKQTFVQFIHAVLSRKEGGYFALSPAGNLQEMQMSLHERFETWKQNYKREGLDEGLKEGLKEGKATALRQLLSQRFGRLAPELEARIDGASVQQIDVWLGRVLRAETLHDIVGHD